MRICNDNYNEIFFGDIILYLFCCFLFYYICDFDIKFYYKLKFRLVIVNWIIFFIIDMVI